MDSLAVPKIDKVIPLNVIEQLIKSVYLIECDYVKKLCGWVLDRNLTFVKINI